MNPSAWRWQLTCETSLLILLLSLSRPLAAMRGSDRRNEPDGLPLSPAVLAPVLPGRCFFTYKVALKKWCRWAASSARGCIHNCLHGFPWPFAPTGREKITPLMWMNTTKYPKWTVLGWRNGDGDDTTIERRNMTISFVDNLPPVVFSPRKIISALTTVYRGFTLDLCMI